MIECMASNWIWIVIAGLVFVAWIAIEIGKDVGVQRYLQRQRDEKDKLDQEEYERRRAVDHVKFQIGVIIREQFKPDALNPGWREMYFPKAKK
jgi:hypothetical protein